MKPYTIVSDRQIDVYKFLLKNIFVAYKRHEKWKVLDAGCGNGSITFPIASCFTCNRH